MVQPVKVKGHGDKHRQRAALLCRQQRRLGLVQVGHGLNDNEIGPGLYTGVHHLPEQLVGPLEGEAPHGLQQLTQGANVQSHLRPGPVHGVLGQSDGRPHYLLHRVSRGGQLAGVCPEGVGVDHLRPRRCVVPVYPGNTRGVRQVQQLGDAAGEQPPLLEDGAHSAVQNQESVLDKVMFHRLFPPCGIGRSLSWCNTRTPAPERAVGYQTGR